MSIFIDGNTYLDTQEVLHEIHVSKPVFYKNIRPLLQVHHFAGRRKPWYKKADISALLAGKTTRHTNIVISGILADWTVYLRSLGFHAETIVRTIETVTLPPDAVEAFGLSPSQSFVKRAKMTLADGAPICAWDTYYPLDLVSGAILEGMKANFDFDVMAAIKAVHGVVVGVARDRYTARLASLEEQELLQLRTNEPILQMQRASYTRSKDRLVIYSDMALLGSWFSPEHEYPVNIW